MTKCLSSPIYIVVCNGATIIAFIQKLNCIEVLRKMIMIKPTKTHKDSENTKFTKFDSKIILKNVKWQQFCFGLNVW